MFCADVSVGIKKLINYRKYDLVLPVMVSVQEKTIFVDFKKIFKVLFFSLQNDFPLKLLTFYGCRKFHFIVETKLMIKGKIDKSAIIILIKYQKLF